MSIESSKKWVLKAENDLKIAKDEITMENPATDAICFHAQQCAEKYLKAYLIFNSKEVRRTHDIAELISQCSEVDPEFAELNQIEIVSLTDYAVEIRYAEDFYFPSMEEAKHAIELAERVKNFVIGKLEKLGFKL
ncbi:HEPN domain-containing protein [candidate division WOR-3 bacterium]|nr:HEPN domain-containing protein [candidate division WOR-3 bacterium]